MKNKILILTLASSILFTSCIGSFSAFNGIREWNEGVTSNKFANELIFLALWIVPVYQFASLGDLVIFNTIEFWSGSNPIAMNEGDIETKVVKGKKSTYAITATKNKFHIEVIEGKNLGAVTELVYNEENTSWSAINEKGKKIKLASLKKGLKVAHLPNGTTIELNAEMNKAASKSYVSYKLNDYKRYNAAFAELD